MLATLIGAIALNQSRDAEAMSELKDHVELDRSTFRDIRGAQQDVNQGADSRQSTHADITGAPNIRQQEYPRIPEDHETYVNKELRITLSPTKAYMHERFETEYKVRQGQVLVKDIGAIEERAAKFATDKIAEYDKELEIEREAMKTRIDRIQLIEANTDQLDNFLREAKSKGWEDIFGPGWNETKRYVRRISLWVLSPKETQDKNDFRARFEQFQRKLVREEDAAAWIDLIGLAYKDVEAIRDRRIQEVQGDKNTMKFRQLLQSRGYYLSRPEQDLIVAEYSNSAANLPKIGTIDARGDETFTKNPAYRNPESFLYGVRPEDPGPEKN